MNDQLSEAIKSLNEQVSATLASKARTPAELLSAAKAAVGLSNENAVVSVSSALKDLCQRELINNVTKYGAADLAALAEAAMILASSDGSKPFAFVL